MIAHIHLLCIFDSFLVIVSIITLLIPLQRLHQLDVKNSVLDEAVYIE